MQISVERRAQQARHVYQYGRYLSQDGHGLLLDVPVAII